MCNTETENLIFSLQALKGWKQYDIAVTREKYCPPVRLSTTADGAKRCREMKGDPKSELWKMWVVGSPANAFDPDPCHSLAKIRKHWQSYNAPRGDAKCCFN